MKLASLRFAPVALLAFIVLAGAFAACTTTPAATLIPCDDPGPVLIRQKDTGFEFCTAGPVHRPKIQACPQFEPEVGKCDGTGGPTQIADCHSNADCAHLGPSMVCGTSSQQLPCACGPGCVTDADCNSGALCQCGDPFSFCRLAFCHSDADCEGGRLCLDSEIEKCDLRGFACQTERDECLTSLDCPDGVHCIYITDHRVCSTKGCGT